MQRFWLTGLELLSETGALLANWIEPLPQIRSSALAEMGWRLLRSQQSLCRASEQTDPDLADEPKFKSRRARAQIT